MDFGPEFIRAIEKSSLEARTWAHDFTNDLGLMGTLTAFEVKAEDQTGANVTSALIEGASVSGVQGLFRIKAAGTSGKNYILTLKGTRNNGDVLVYYILLRVRDKTYV